MSLPRDLLAQAQFLAIREPRRPKGASLRRVVSIAYYALFHLLTDEASRFLISGSNRDSLRNLVVRGFVHSEMSRTAKAFLSGYGRLALHIQSIISGASQEPPDFLRSSERWPLLSSIFKQLDMRQITMCPIVGNSKFN